MALGGKMLFPPQSYKLPAFITIIIIAGYLVSFSIPAEGQSKRTKGGTAKSSKRKSHSKSSRHSRQSRYGAQDDPLPLAAYQAPPTYPDSIEVIEYGSSDPILGRLLNMPNTTNLTSTNLEAIDTSNPSKRVNVKMEASRVYEIQQALASRGFYQGEPTGNYDEATVEAMRRFQQTENIPVTGYPTAHALRRLGLAKW
jgi:putative peptidoglycan binding protein